RHPQKSLHKFSVGGGVNVRVRDLDLRAAEKIGFHLGPVEMWMIKADRIRAEKSVEIDQALIVDRVVQIRAAAFFQIDHDLETIEKHMLLERFQDAGGAVIFRAAF